MPRTDEDKRWGPCGLVYFFAGGLATASNNWMLLAANDYTWRTNYILSPEDKSYGEDSPSTVIPLLAYTGAFLQAVASGVAIAGKENNPGLTPLYRFLIAANVPIGTYNATLFLAPLFWTTATLRTSYDIARGAWQDAAQALSDTPTSSNPQDPDPIDKAVNAYRTADNFTGDNKIKAAIFQGAYIGLWVITAQTLRPMFRDAEDARLVEGDNIREYIADCIGATAAGITVHAAAAAAKPVANAVTTLWSKAGELYDRTRYTVRNRGQIQDDGIQGVELGPTGSSRNYGSINP
jgi:hypothetical protein